MTLSEDMLRLEIQELLLEINDVEILLDKKKSLLEEKSNQLRSLCKHKKTQYFPDPSGNNDSFHVCLDCGLEKKRF